MILINFKILTLAITKSWKYKAIHLRHVQNSQNLLLLTIIFEYCEKEHSHIRYISENYLSSGKIENINKILGILFDA